jgi:hypothetical protein
MLEKGEELVILDDMILNVKQYKGYHPGSEFVLR